MYMLAADNTQNLNLRTYSYFAVSNMQRIFVMHDLRMANVFL